MSRPEIVRLAAALRGHTSRTIERQVRSHYRGEVKRVDPLSVDVAGLDVGLLDDEEVTIGDALAARITARGGLRVGDTLALVEMDDDDFVAVELLPDE